jgi:predicted RNA binding protein YcfA (HicA-like mRNA interferase family)
VRRLEAAGFRLRRQTGSHARYVHADGRKVTVPIHPRDIAVPVLRSILQQARLTPDEWEAL